MIKSADVTARLGLAGKIRAGRAFVLVSAVFSAGLLALALWADVNAREAMLKAEAGLVQARDALDRAELQKTIALRKVELARLNEALERKADAMNMQSRDWAARKVSVKQQVMERSSIHDALAELERTSGRVFVAEEFDLGVTRPGDGLFDIEGVGEGPLRLSVRGDLHFRVGE